MVTVLGRGGKRGGAREHCSQKEMAGTIFGRRIWDKSTALVTTFIRKAIHRIYAVKPIIIILIGNIKVLVKYISLS